jgi:transposase
MDKACSDTETRNQVEKAGLIPNVPPRKNAREPQEYNSEIYKLHNEVEKFFRRLKAYRRVFAHHEKLDVMYHGMISFIMVFEALRGDDV